MRRRSDCECSCSGPSSARELLPMRSPLVAGIASTVQSTCRRQATSATAARREAPCRSSGPRRCRWAPLGEVQLLLSLLPAGARLQGQRTVRRRRVLRQLLGLPLRRGGAWPARRRRLAAREAPRSRLACCGTRTRPSACTWARILRYMGMPASQRPSGANRCLPTLLGHSSMHMPRRSSSSAWPRRPPLATAMVAAALSRYLEAHGSMAAWAPPPRPQRWRPHLRWRPLSPRIGLLRRGRDEVPPRSSQRRTKRQQQPEMRMTWMTGAGWTRRTSWTAWMLVLHEAPTRAAGGRRSPRLRARRPRGSCLERMRWTTCGVRCCNVFRSTRTGSLSRSSLEFTGWVVWPGRRSFAASPMAACRCAWAAAG